MDEFAFDKSGFAYLPVDIKPRYTSLMHSVMFKVDSGANCTTISSTQLLTLGYDEDWIRSGKLLAGNARPTLASGLAVDDCFEVILPEIRIGDWVGYNWPFIASISVPFRFLLGTDSMQFFNWHFDYENGVCKFSLIPGMRKLLFNQREQSIHEVDEMG